MAALVSDNQLQATRTSTDGDSGGIDFSKLGGGAGGIPGMGGMEGMEGEDDEGDEEDDEEMPELEDDAAAGAKEGKKIEEVE